MKRAGGGQGEYRQLRAEWYRRLAASGFVDVELPDGRLVDHNAQYYWDGRDNCVRTARAAYYVAAGEYLWATDWAGRAGERAIWELHAEGRSMRAIAERLGIGKSSAHRCVARHRRIVLESQETVATPGLLSL